MTKKELLKLLKNAKKGFEKYNFPKEKQEVILNVDTLIEALSEKPEIIICKDCRWYRKETKFCYLHELFCEKDFYCANAERRKNDA